MTHSKSQLVALAQHFGFDHVKFTTVVDPTPWSEHYSGWLREGHHGAMAYLERGQEVRAHPRTRMASARTAMVLGVDHHHHRPADPGPLHGLVARYAWGRDYHNVVGKRLKKLQRELRNQGVRTWGGVDTAPILERSWASASGLGFNGKNSVQIWPARGSWMVLGVTFLDLEVTPDEPLRDHCGTCQRCLVGCPTDAFVTARELNARRCIAYWTIEARTLAPRALRRSFGRWVFGCDVCQEVCPHNVRPPDPDDEAFAPRHAWLDLIQLLHTDDDALMEQFIGTPLRRPGAAGLKRNALVALANTGDPNAVPAAEHAMSHAAPVVRQAAVWCLKELGCPPPPGYRDGDPDVQDELTCMPHASDARS